MTFNKRLKFFLLSIIIWLPVRIAREIIAKPQTGFTSRNLQSQIPNQLLVDVSVLIKSDARTGVQRVVRALLLQLIQAPPTGFLVRPVFVSKNGNYRYAPEGFGLIQVEPVAAGLCSEVDVKAGDIFLALDLAANLLPFKRKNLARWKLLGVEIHFVVYDLLPVLHPEWFKSKTTANFHKWLHLIALLADNVICISRVVCHDFNRWTTCRYSVSQPKIKISVIPLGADIESTLPTDGVAAPDRLQLETIYSKPTALMVGTLEPRKGHAEILDAFDLLWRQGRDINLVVVGNAGWKTGVLQQRLRLHPRFNTRLFWLENVSDELLEAHYRACTGLIAASFNEGFGLPIVEAARFKKPVLARDIAVFREIAGNEVTFFQDNAAATLPATISSWLRKSVMPAFPLQAPSPTTWYASSRCLLDCMGLESSRHNDLLSLTKQPVG